MSSVLKIKPTKPEEMTISERVKFAMDYRGWKQTHLAAHSGLTNGRISQIIKDGGTPSGPAIFRIADALGFEARWITFGEGPMLKEESFHKAS